MKLKLRQFLFYFPPSIIKPKAFQLLLNFFLQIAAFLEHCGKLFCVGFHLGVEFFRRNIDVFNFDVKILARAEDVAFFNDFIICNGNAEIFHGFFFKECINNLVNFKVSQAAFLVAAFLVFLAEF